MIVPPVCPICAQELSRHSAMASRNWWSDRAAASWLDGAAGGYMPEAHSTLLLGAVQLRTQSGLLLPTLSVDMLWLLLRVIQRKGCASSANETTQRRTERLWLTQERVEEERESVLAAKSTVAQAQDTHEEHVATRLSVEDLVVQQLQV